MSDPISEKYPVRTTEKSALEKEWACGSKEWSAHDEFIIRDDMSTGFAPVKYAPAWWKIIDEALVNAIDHFIRQYGSADPVTQIRFEFDPSGFIKVWNDGRGIDICIHPQASKEFGREIWLPTFLFGMMNQSGNDKPAPDCIIGGTNGFGAKLSIIYSSYGILETVDKARNMYFQQQWLDHMQIAQPPIVINMALKNTLSTAQKSQHTVLKFMPDYSIYKIEWSIETYKELLPLVRARAYFAAAYCNYTISSQPKKQKFTFSFNGEIIDPTMSAIAKMAFPSAQILHAVIPAPEHEVYHYPWEICIALTNSAMLPFKHIGNVNGIMVGGGTHYKYIKEALTNGVKTLMVKKLKDKALVLPPSKVVEHAFIFVNCKIPCPNWTGQRKDVLSTPIKNFAPYSIPPKILNPFSAHIECILTNKILKKKSRAPATVYEKYTKAALAGTKEAAQCSLLFVEGDSAKTQVEIAIAKVLGSDYYGVISTAGVPVNARKQCTEINGMKKMSKMLENNLFIKGFIQALGLNKSFTYNKSGANYAAEMKSLKYGCVVACVDQDLDGKGQILGLVLSLFDYFWPQLLANGFVKWFGTPIIRAYPKVGTKILSFYNIAEFRQWESTDNVSDYNIKYYKGLGTHNRDESLHMFGEFKSRVYSFYIDEKTHELFNIYYGKVPDLRKTKLRAPQLMLTDEQILEQDRERRISCSDQLEQCTHEYQLDNLDRKLIHIIDGQNQAGRKIIDGIMKTFKSGKEIKVDKLAGFISEKENYQHGAASLEDSIIARCLLTAGGVQLPCILPRSQSGTRKNGTEDAVKPRYHDTLANVRLNKLLFPAADYELLDFHFDEGKRGEPKYFIPILPLAVLESAHIPSNGWKLKVWARCVFECITNIKNMINHGDDIPLNKMTPARYTGTSYEWKGEFRVIKGTNYSVGKYKYFEETNSIYVYELPLRQWTDKYVANITKKIDEGMINSINAGKSDDLIVHIMIKLLPGAIDVLETLGNGIYTDGIEEYFQLCEPIDDHLNLINTNGAVIMLDDYREIMYRWFAERKQLYARRIERMRALIELDIVRMRNIVRYIKESAPYKMSGRSKESMNNILAENKYDRINTARINEPDFIPTSELSAVILFGPDAKYKYLLNISDSGKSLEALAKRAVELERLERKLSDLDIIANTGRFIGAKMFIDEINEIEGVIRDGFKTFWLFEEQGKFKF